MVGGWWVVVIVGCGPSSPAVWMSVPVHSETKVGQVRV